ncbi:isopenicillin N synthase family dioxygenase [Methylocapsa palsarum]|uniref:2-oxoglutarate-dependent ethylene/succinate-forming enzyme n=1 Tax=Methylocapsa palsarum TaxID=1612308 RepID=A0A1I3XS81_9HYPH|nr:2-oxoglutarate and iron-dependent oxygenase domain-containing protein [Methylocapsa palsarum]SFK22388.1 Isopenicillin N synthase [Methylocapsa palsarum]
MNSLPLLDLSRLGGSPRDREAFLADLRSAAREAGFFYLSGHGLGAQVCQTLFAEARRFFALPEAEKLAVEMIRSPHFRGYSRPGAELTRGKPDWREQFDIGAEREAVWRSGDPAWLRLQGPNQWPDSLPELRAALLGWRGALTEVSIRLLRAFAEALGQDREAFAPIYAGAPNQHVKIIRYPGGDGASGDQGVGAHKDSELLTLLLQDDQDGLEVEVEEGRWIKAPPRAGTFVVNIGELLELASNGYLRATMHRVVAPPPGRERFSIAFFLGARLDARTPLLDLPLELAAQAHGPASDPANPLLRHAGENYLKGRLRSHPDVAARYYASGHADKLQGQIAGEGSGSV